MSLDEQLIIDSQALVVKVFKDLRPQLMAAFGNVEHTSKRDRSPVTEWDIIVENRLRDELEQAFPNMGFEGEETGRHGNRETYWLVDPIDGTSSFIRGLPFSTNMAALVHQGHVLASVIYDFVNDTLYTAVKDKGAYKDGRRIHVNDQREPGNLFIYSLSRQSFDDVQRKLGKRGMRLMLPIGAAGHDYAMLAEGKIDGVIVLYTRTGAHDNAPGLLLAEEAGAVMLQYDEAVGVDRHEFIIGTRTVIDQIRKAALF